MPVGKPRRVDEPIVIVLLSRARIDHFDDCFVNDCQLFDDHDSHNETGLPQHIRADL